MIRILLGLSLIPTLLFAQATDDNEVWIDQEGDTLTLYIDQIGFGNKIGADDFSNGSPGTMSIVGSSLTFDLDFLGNQNLLYGPLTADSSTYNLSFTGDSNALDWHIGSSNIFDLDFESDDNTWNWDITGDSNNINVLMNDGSHEQTVVFVGDSADIDINQISGTCAAGAGTSCATPNGNIQLDIESDNATIQINQKDSSNDS